MLPGHGNFSASPQGGGQRVALPRGRTFGSDSSNPRDPALAVKVRMVGNSSHASLPLKRSSKPECNIANDRCRQEEFVQRDNAIASWLYDGGTVRGNPFARFLSHDAGKR